MKPTTKAYLWDALQTHAKSSGLGPRKDPSFNAAACNIQIDYSNQHITHRTLELLHALAESVDLRQKIHGLMRGDTVNHSENRPALHTALRASGETPIWVEQCDVMPAIMNARHKIRDISERIRSNQWLGFTGRPVTDIVNIGIGGSDFGPRFCLSALAQYTSPHLKYHFISDIDPDGFKQTIKALQPETTLFIIASKSFTTQETLYNAKKAIAWVGGEHIASHFIAVTAQTKKAHSLGIETVLPIWDWIGGRYSLCSAINLITSIAIGFAAFEKLLSGANSMDNHFHDTAFPRNLPVILALLGVWNNNFLHRHNLLILTYSRYLEQFVPFIQQLDMESNGKCTDNQGVGVTHSTGPLIWGGLGNQAQHSYYQLLCQGTHRVAADFVTMNTLNGDLINELCTAKIRVLTTGVLAPENPIEHISPNLPLNHIQIKNNSPFTIGALIALYEHKIFVQSVIWNINPFDQPGVESAKRFKASEQIKKTEALDRHMN